MVCCAEWKFERRSRADFSSGVSRSNRSGTRETVSRSNRQAPSLPRASVTCHSVSRPRIRGSASQVSATVIRSTPSRRRTASSLAASRSPMPARSSGGMRVEVEAGQEDFGLDRRRTPARPSTRGTCAAPCGASPARRARPAEAAPSRPCRRPAPPRRSPRRWWRSAGRGLWRGGLRPGRRGCASVPRENSQASCPSGRRTRSSMIRPRWLECQT